jgi:hypothetical protein
LVLNIVDEDEGYEKLCPFIQFTDGSCQTPYNHFPHLNRAPLREESNSESCVDKVAGSAPRFAYVMLLGDVSQSRDYFTAALVLAQNIRNTGTTADIVAMNFGYLKEEDRALLESFGVIIKKIKGVGTIPSNDPGPFDARTAAIYRAKIRALQLTDYTRIIFVDLDVILLQNIDHLFAIDHFTALSGGNSPFNAGLFVLTPSCQDFVDVNDVATSDSFTVERGWNDYGPFPHWLRQNEMSDWSFYAAQAEQGLMHYYFNCYKKSGEMLPIGAWDSLATHLVGSHKPWYFGHEGPSDSHIERLPKRFRAATRIWYKVYAQMMAFIQETNAEMSSFAQLSEQAMRRFVGPDPYTEDAYCDHCKVSKWGKWGTCSAKCGPGTQTRTRTVTQEPTCNNTCPTLNETRPCVGKHCNKTENDWFFNAQLSVEKMIAEFCGSRVSAVFDMKMCRQYVQELLVSHEDEEVEAEEVVVEKVEKVSSKSSKSKSKILIE